MYGEKFQWDPSAQDPHEWIIHMSKMSTYVDHYFIDLTAKFLNRRIIIYPLFEIEVRVDTSKYSLSFVPHIVREISVTQ